MTEKESRYLKQRSRKTENNEKRNQDNYCNKMSDWNREKLS
jgi:hypothetical protein